MEDIKLKELQEHKKRVEFVKSAFDKFINDERYKQYNELLQGMIDDMKDKIIDLINSEDTNRHDKELLLTGEINAYKNILELPKQFIKSLELVNEEIKLRNERKWKKRM